jgi:hypothetical protein
MAARTGSSMTLSAETETGIPQRRVMTNVEVTVRWRGIVGFPNRMLNRRWFFSSI